MRILTVNKDKGEHTLLSKVFCPKDELLPLKTSNNRLLEYYKTWHASPRYQGETCQGESLQCET